MKHYKLENVSRVFSLAEMIADPVKKKNLVRENPVSNSVIEYNMKDREEDLLGTLESAGFRDPVIRYDLSCCQGSGASFTFTRVNWNDLFQFNDEGKDLQNYIQQHFPNTWQYLDSMDALPTVAGKSNYFANHYTHSKTVDIVVDWPDQYEQDLPLMYKDLDNTTQYQEFKKEVEKTITSIYYNLCSDIYKNLDSTYSYFTSEDAVIEELKSNDWDSFTEDGTIFNPERLEMNGFSVVKLTEYVLIDRDGKIFSLNDQGCRLFLDTVDQPDLGYGNAVIFTDILEAETVRDNLIYNRDNVIEVEIKKAEDVFCIK